MKPLQHFFPMLSFLAVSLVLCLPVGTFGKGVDEKTVTDGQLHQRIDFSSSQILGQSIKSGAVYLMHRKKSDISTMIEVRQHYRKEIKEEYEIDQTAIARDGSDK